MSTISASFSRQTGNVMKQLARMTMILMLAVWVLPALAQQTYSNASGITVTVPPGWTTFDAEGGLITFSPDESAGAWFQVFNVENATVNGTCLPNVLDFFVKSLAVGEIKLDEAALNLAYIDYDNKNGIGVVACDVIAPNVVVGSALVSAQNTYDVNWPILVDLYRGFTINSPQAAAPDNAVMIPNNNQTVLLNGIAFEPFPGWSVSETGDAYALLTDASGTAIVYLEYRPRTETMTMDSCLSGFVDELSAVGLADITPANTGYLEGQQTAYVEFTFSAATRIGAAACNLDSAQFAHLWLITVPRESFDALWPTQLNIITSAQFPGVQSAQQSSAPAQPPAQTNAIAPSVDANDPFAALGGVAQPQQPTTSNNPFVQSGVISQSPSNLTFVSFTDPREGAFRVDVPQGWAVEGGMYDVFGTKLIFYGMTSPDESVVTFVGQTEILISLQPTPQLTQAGYPEGSAVYADNNFYIRVAAYQTGAEAARVLVEANFAPLCSQFEFTAIRELPDASGFTADQTALISAGEVAYTCTIEGVPAVGYQYATTYATVDPTYGQVWMIQDIYGFIAEASRVDEAITALVRASNTLSISEGWIRQQQQQFAQQQMNDPAYYALLSQVSATMHETNMAIINSIGGGSTWEWEYTYDYGW